MSESSDLKHSTRGSPADSAPRRDIPIRKPLNNVHSVILVCTSKDEIVVEIVISINTVSAALLHKARGVTYSP
jgi:hypothetical protein